MPLQSILATALPNGFTGDGKLRLSVLVSPRLEPQLAPAELRSFVDFAAWPTTLAAAKFTVQLGAKKVTLTGKDFDATIGVPDIATWTALFPGTTFVRSFAMHDHSDDTVVSYDTAGMAEFVGRLYGQLTAAATGQLPTIAELLANPEIATLVGAVEEIDGQFWNADRHTRDVPELFDGYRDGFKGLKPLSAPFAAFQVFHTPPSAPVQQTAQRPDDDRLAATWQTHKRAEFDAAKAVKDLDFHQMVAAMNQYPTLLRRLGLVVDFVIPRTAFDAGADLPLSVDVVLPAPKAEVRDTKLRVVQRNAAPATRTQLSAKTFSAVSRPNPAAEDLRVSGGLLVLDEKKFALLQADVDGAGHKLMNLARSLLSARRYPSRQVDAVTKLPRHMGAPALRNAGLTLVQKKRGKLLEKTFERNKTLDSAIKQMFTLPTAAVPGLYAEDLIRGYRVDIWDKSKNTWKSLCERIADYEIAKGAVRIAGLREEGTVRLGATSSADGYNADLVYLHETVTVWNGWSLVAQQPGLTVALNPELAATPDETVRDSAADVPEGIPLRTTFVATPGSLPRLRYGREYAVRARVVDLAGNSLPPTPANYGGNDSSIAAAKPYLRFEPVPPPTFALVGQGKTVQLPLEGESMARVAVRTMNDRFDDPTPTTQVTLRWGVPTRVPQREAELHGVLDGPGWGTPEQHAMLVARDAELGHIDVSIGASDATARSAGSSADRARLVEPGTPATYATLAAGATQLPYLPDPLCTHLAVRLLNYPFAGLPAPIEIPLYPAGTTWPNAAPFLIRVYEKAGDEPRWDEASRTLLIPVPKAVRATLRLSAKLVPETLKLMGVWSWVPQEKRTAALERLARNGGLWPLTPWRELEIVHAVQRPLLSPAFNRLELERPPAATWVKPGVDAVCHCASTDRVDLHAAWHDPHDAPNSVAPRNDAKTEVAFSVKITDPLGYAGVREHLLPDPADPNRIVFGPNSGSKEEQETLVEKIHDFGDTRYRRVEYHLVATSRFREYMPKNPPAKGPLASVGTEAGLTVAGPGQTTWALASAAPPAPEVLYVVPTFAWTRATEANGKQTSNRRGLGLRVWLDRPWNASGYGEMLGVILPMMGTPTDPNDQPYKNTVTQWGNDPIWKSPFVQGATPSVLAFPLARTAPDPTGAWVPPGAPQEEKLQPPGPFRTRSLPHAGLPLNSSTGLVDVAPHDVFWDPDRRLWYCDIELPSTGAYFPFVRLALARYQPSALRHAHLSNVVLTDFASLAPHRSLTVTRTSATRRQVQVFGISHQESSGYREAETWREMNNAETGRLNTEVPTGISAKNVIEVWVEQLNAAQGEDFGWYRVAADTSGWGPATEVTTADAGVRLASSTTVKATTTTTSTASRLTVEKATVAEKGPVLAGENATVVPTNPSAEWAALWSGAIDLPSAPSATKRFRLVVAEYEEYLADGPNPYGNRPEMKTRRLVFVEHVELT